MTYSIVARDPETGELGIAVQSHWFAVGPIVPWARPGVGAVATQANVAVAYGPAGLDALARGEPPAQALSGLLAADPKRAHRQVAMVAADGAVAAHTGSACLRYAGDIQGDGVSCQANIMTSEAVWPAMLEAYADADGPLPQRLLTALFAAEGAGGDLRGRQSAAILVVPAAGEPWETVTSLRVEDHPEPLVELERLVRFDQAYRLASRGDECLAAARFDDAARLYGEAVAQAPESDELQFWAGLGAAQSGDLETGLRHIRAAIAVQPAWREMLARLTPDHAPAAAAVLDQLT